MGSSKVKAPLSARRRREWTVPLKKAISLLGVRVDCLRKAQLIDRALSPVRPALTIMYVNVHCMNVATRDDAYRAILNSADVVSCDGTGVRLASRLLGETLPERMTGADWIVDLCTRAQAERKALYLFGGAPGVAQSARERLLQDFPNLRICGTSDGYRRGDDLLKEINARRPDILLVGMGTPRQEKWVAANRDALDIPTVWVVGALFDFVSGRIRRGPRWMTDHGLEWLCRLVAEPRKLWRRYLVGNPLFLYNVLRMHFLGGGRPK
jgi:N-acetylglucosaminyldiphosphoundecaprenol N-acetyl-beta-D-mannosaminyltransferase